MEVDSVLRSLSDAVNSIFTLELCCGVPVIIAVVLTGMVFFTLRLGFVNIRMFRHATRILFNRSGALSFQDNKFGYVNHFQAFSTAISGTVGLGTISGVAISLAIGGPGSLFWMLITGVFGMSCKFAEVFLGLRYRIEGAKGVIGGPFVYISGAFKERNLASLGIVISVIYAILLIFSMLGGLAFQANQSVVLMRGKIGFVDSHFEFFALLFTTFVFAVISGSLRRIVYVVTALMPVMVGLHVLTCLVVIYFNIDNFVPVLHAIIEGAFAPEAGAGGIIAAFSIGMRRGIFASEVAVGSASIAHAATKEKEPVRAALVAMLEPCIDTILVSGVTGFALLMIGQKISGDGIVAVQSMFSNVYPVCGWIMNVAAPLFGFSTILSYSYYCEVSWRFLFKRGIIGSRAAVLCTVFFSSIATNVMDIAVLGDALFMILAFLNITIMAMFSSDVVRGLKAYNDVCHGS